MKITLDPERMTHKLELNSSELAVILASVKLAAVYVEPEDEGGLELYHVRNQFIEKFGR